MLDPVAYARAKQRAKRRAAAKGAAIAGDGSPPAQPDSSSWPRAVLFGSLTAVGLNAKEQIKEEGLKGEFTPPDTTGAIGPNQYVEFVNSQVRVFERSNLLAAGAAVNLSKFTGGTVVCDPQIKYDPQAKRWFYAALRCDGTKAENMLYLGFSKTGDPRDLSIEKGHGWCGYEYPTGKTLEDYPKLGLDSSHMIIGTNAFNAETSTFETSHILAGPKPKEPIVGECPAKGPELTKFGGPLKTLLGNSAVLTPEPATIGDGSPSGYVVSADIEFKLTPPQFIRGEHLMLWHVGGTESAPKLEPVTELTVPLFEFPPSVPQPGSADEIDTLEGRLTQAVAASDPNAGGAEGVWTQHTIEGGAGSVVRWYEIVPSELEVRQIGTIADPTRFVFNGAIAPTVNGGAVINYNTGSISDPVRIMAQSRIGAAPPGSMNAPIELGSSAAIDSDFSCGSQPTAEEEAPCRWGDYAGASVDPVNGNLVWGSNQLNGPTGEPFETEIVNELNEKEKVIVNGAQWVTKNFALEPNDVAPTAAFTITPNPATMSLPVSFNGSGSSDVDGTVTSYSWTFGDGTSSLGVTPAHIYTAPGNYAVTLTVTDNGGLTGTATHVVTVTVKPALAAGGKGGPPPPNSNFSTLGATVDPATGAVTLTLTVADAGQFSWLATFQNGKFGVFAAKNSKCKKGFVKLNGKCRPARVAFSKGSQAVSSPGSVRVTLKPTGSASKALKNALKRKKGLPVTVVLTFQSSAGGAPVSHTQSLTVRLKKK